MCIIKRNSKWYDDNKQKILKRYYENIGVQDIADELHCSRYMIYSKFNEWDIKRRPRKKSAPRCNAKYKVDYHYFDIINTEHKAYWFGFLMADGFVNNTEISLCLQKSDIHMIKQFATDLKCNAPIKYNKDGNPFLTITCKSMCNSLISKGFHNRKSWDLDFDFLRSFVPEPLLRHFIRGMFDGDGCLKYYQYPYLNKPQIHLGYTGLENVCQFIRSYFHIDRPLIHEKNKTYTVVTRKPELVLQICSYMYDDCDIYLLRKYNTYHEIKMMTFNDYNKAVS